MKSLTLPTSGTLVCPHFRGRAVMEESFGKLFEPETTSEEAQDIIRNSSLEMRQNIQRIMTAAWAAQAGDADMAAVEGWRGHEIRHERTTEYVRGDAITRIILDMLQHRGLVSDTLTLHRREKPFARSTEDEALELRDMMEQLGLKNLFSVTHTPNPSPLRAGRTLGRVIRPPLTVQVATPRDLVHALKESGHTFTAEQVEVMGACGLRNDEWWKGLVEEYGVNLPLDIVSQGLHRIAPTMFGGKTLMQWLANKRRKDRGGDVVERV